MANQSEWIGGRVRMNATIETDFGENPYYNPFSRWLIMPEAEEYVGEILDEKYRLWRFGGGIVPGADRSLHAGLSKSFGGGL